MNNMKPLRGTYALVRFAPEASPPIPIGQRGRMGAITLVPGCYVYIGSAFGPGGVPGRVGRHLDLFRPVKWHLDWLKPYTHYEELWYTNDQIKRECSWAKVVQELPGAEIHLAGFGSTDCYCDAHLYNFERHPSFRVFCKRIKQSIPGHAAVHLASKAELDSLLRERRSA